MPSVFRGREGVLLVQVLLKSFEKLLPRTVISLLGNVELSQNCQRDGKKEKEKEGRGGERLQSHKTWQEDQGAAEVPEKEFNSFF